MRPLLVACALLLTGCPADWTHGDTARETVLLTETGLDWHQTRSVVVPGCLEDNPIIGSCGQNVNVDVYFVAIVGLELLSSRVIPHRYRSAIHWMLIGVETATTWRNYQDGTGL